MSTLGGCALLVGVGLIPLVLWLFVAVPIVPDPLKSGGLLLLTSFFFAMVGGTGVITLARGGINQGPIHISGPSASGMGLLLTVLGFGLALWCAVLGILRF